MGNGVDPSVVIATGTPMLGARDSWCESEDYAAFLGIPVSVRCMLLDTEHGGWLFRV